MDFYSITKLVSLSIHTILGLYVLLKSPRKRLNQAFCLSTLSIAIMEFGYFMFLMGLEQALWLRIALMGHCLASANVVLLSVVYGRENYRDSLETGKPYLIVIYVVSLAFLVLASLGILEIQFSDISSDSLDTAPTTETRYGLVFGRAELILLTFLLMCTLVALMNLENTYRRGGGRRIRYPAMVLMGTLAFHIFIYSIGLGFSYIRMDVLMVASVALMVANVCIAYPVIRPELSESRIYVSRGVIARSYTLLLAGIYLLVIGMLGKIIQIIGRNLNFFLAFLVAFFVILIFMLAILSRSIKRRLQSFIGRNFYKNRYDYRVEWENFSRRVFSILSVEDLLREVVNAVSDTVDANEVSMILLDERGPEHQVISTQQSMERVITLCLETSVAEGEFLDWLWRYGRPIRVDGGQCKAVGTSSASPGIPEALLSVLDDPQSPETHVVEDHAVRDGIIVPIAAERKLIAVMVLGRRPAVSYSQEDMDLLETMANQVSIAIMNAKTSQELALSREMESLYRVSAMLMHDLKSSASMLSLVVQNAADNFDNPEFQKDALNTMSNVVNRIQRLILKLSTAREGMELEPELQLVDLTEIVSGAIARSGVREVPRIRVVEEFHSTPQIMTDPENIERVTMNLILNAVEAIDDEGVITIETRRVDDRYAQISVSDTGCGMSRDFIQNKLFRPFQTTKERGLGIGLYQCKAMVDALGGSIGVQSDSGLGSAFVVKLPIQSPQEARKVEATEPSTS